MGYVFKVDSIYFGLLTFHFDGVGPIESLQLLVQIAVMVGWLVK